MKSTMWYLLALALLKFSHCLAAKSCSIPEFAEEVDWSKMDDTWYDVIDIPTPPTAVDLYDWHDVTVTEGGFRTLLDQWTCGNSKKETFVDDFIRIRPGVYVLNPEYKHTFVNATIKSASHKGGDFEDIVGPLDEIYSWEWFFATDYENYFLPVVCTKAGWASFIKSRRTRLDLDTLVKIWNALVAMDVGGEIYLKNEECRGSLNSCAS